MRESLPPITFIATALASPILAGSDRSTLPGPSVMTNIWPTPTITMKTASDSAAVIMPPRAIAAGEGDCRQPHNEGADE